jgi:hypothetical protein
MVKHLKCLREEIVKGKTESKRQAQAKKADFVDWLLAIDAC